MNIPILPYASLGAGAQVDITFSTADNPSESGIAGTKSFRDQAIRHYTLSISPDHAAEAMAILMAVRGSKWPLAIRDYTNYQLSNEPQTWTAETDGAVIDLAKAYTPLTGTRTYSQRILIIDQEDEAFQVKINGSPATSGSWSLSDPGILTVQGLASGDVVTVTGEFLIPVRFMDDAISVTMHTNSTFSIEGLHLKEILEQELINLTA